MEGRRVLPIIVVIIIIIIVIIIIIIIVKEDIIKGHYKIVVSRSTTLARQCGSPSPSPLPSPNAAPTMLF